MTAADITITNIINATSGNGIQFEIFVRGMGGDSVLSQQQLLTALRVRPPSLLEIKVYLVNYCVVLVLVYMWKTLSIPHERARYIF